MKTLMIYLSNGEVWKSRAIGTIPEIQKTYFIGREYGEEKQTIEALTIN